MIDELFLANEGVFSHTTGQEVDEEVVVREEPVVDDIEDESIEREETKGVDSDFEHDVNEIPRIEL